MQARTQSIGQEPPKHRTQSIGEEYEVHSIADNQLDPKMDIETKLTPKGKYVTTYREMYGQGKDADKKYILRIADNLEDAKKDHKEITEYINKGYHPAEIPPRDTKIIVFDKPTRVHIDGVEIDVNKYDTALLDKEGKIQDVGFTDTLKEGKATEIETIEHVVPPEEIFGEDYLTAHPMEQGKMEEIADRQSWEETKEGKQHSVYTMNIAYSDGHDRLDNVAVEGKDKEKGIVEGLNTDMLSDESYPIQAAMKAVDLQRSKDLRKEIENVNQKTEQREKEMEVRTVKITTDKGEQYATIVKDKSSNEYTVARGANSQKKAAENLNAIQKSITEGKAIEGKQDLAIPKKDLDKAFSSEKGYIPAIYLAKEKEQTRAKEQAASKVIHKHIQQKKGVHRKQSGRNHGMEI